MWDVVRVVDGDRCCENNIMIDRDARGEREELVPETVVSSSSDSFNFYKQCTCMFLSPLSMVSHSHQVAELANSISDLTN